MRSILALIVCAVMLAVLIWLEANHAASRESYTQIIQVITEHGIEEIEYVGTQKWND